jgi:hypothetical protein
MFSRRHASPSFERCAREGYYFCVDCQHIVSFGGDQLRGICPECGSGRVLWQPPVTACPVPDSRRFSNVVND